MTANEGDAQEEDDCIGGLLLDRLVFPDAVNLQLDGQVLFDVIDKNGFE